MWQWPGRVTIVESLASTRTWVPIPALGPKLCDAGHPSTRWRHAVHPAQKGPRAVPSTQQVPKKWHSCCCFCFAKIKKTGQRSRGGSEA